MPSRKPVEPLFDLETDVPVPPAVAEAQWRIRNERKLSSAEYLAWCAWITRDRVEPARDFHTEPFELFDP